MTLGDVRSPGGVAENFVSVSIGTKGRRPGSESEAVCVWRLPIISFLPKQDVGMEDPVRSYSEPQ
jgi:hypothetical protein